MAGNALEALDLLKRDYAGTVLAPPVHVPEQMAWTGTSLSIAGVSLLVGEGELSEIVETPAVTSIPGTKPWVMGVASHMGGLLPIISGDVLFRGKAYAGRVRDYCMVIRRPGFYFGITLSDVERDVNFPLDQRDMDYPVDEAFSAFTLGGFHYGERFLAILDIDKLVGDSDLSNAAAAGPVLNEEKTDD
jgi:twitching motility protein PilI